jgi:protease I
MSERLNGKKVAIVAADMVERVELVEPRKALEAEGAETELISLGPGSILTANHFDQAGSEPVDRVIGDVEPDEYDALLIPGGVANPDLLRTSEDVVGFVRGAYASGKPIAAICHGPWVLVEADLVRDHTVTSWPSLRTDITNAGGSWVDRDVVTDEGIVTSREPDDIPAFNGKMIEEFAEGIHERRGAQVVEAR